MAADAASDARRDADSRDADLRDAASREAEPTRGTTATEGMSPPSPGASAPLANTLATALPIALAIAAAAILARRPDWRRLPRIPAGALPRDPAIGLAAMFGFILAGSVGAIAAAALLPTGLADGPFGRLARGAAMNAAQIALAVAVLRSALVARAPRAATAAPRALLEGAVAFALVLPLVATLAIAVNALAIALGLPPAPETSHETLAILRREGDPLLSALTLAHVAILVPLAEEAGWRGLLQPAFRTVLGPWRACVSTAALFALIHWSAIPPEGRPAGLAMLVALGVALGALRERTGGILAPAVLHGLFNAANVALALA
ncbi:MAG: hypothetical protein RI967_132 [Planctomycetota bacterium]